MNFKYLFLAIIQACLAFLFYLSFKILIEREDYNGIYEFQKWRVKFSNFLVQTFLIIGSIYDFLLFLNIL
jgi:hypothetical protein